MLIERLELWLAATNTYVVAREAGGPALVVDAPPDPDERLPSLLARLRLIPVGLLLTHAHVDHIGGASRFVERSGVTAYLHPDDDYLALHPAEQMRLVFGFMPGPEHRPPRTLRPLEDGLSLDLGGLRVEVLATPGHTPGHCCFHLPEEGILFSGDQLFAGSIGRTDLAGGDHAALIRSMSAKVLPLDDDVSVLPGHGPATTVGLERRTNPFLAGLS